MPDRYDPRTKTGEDVAKSLTTVTRLVHTQSDPIFDNIYSGNEPSHLLPLATEEEPFLPLATEKIANSLTPVGHKSVSMDDSGYQPTDFELPNIKQNKTSRQSWMSLGDRTAATAATLYRSTARNGAASKNHQTSIDSLQRTKGGDSGQVSCSSREWSPRTGNPAAETYGSANNIFTYEERVVLENIPDEPPQNNTNNKPAVHYTQTINSESDCKDELGRWTFTVKNSNPFNSSANPSDVPDRIQRLPQSQYQHQQQQQQLHHVQHRQEGKRFRQSDDKRQSQISDIHITSITNLAKTRNRSSTAYYSGAVGTSFGLFKPDRQRLTLSVLNSPRNTANVNVPTSGPSVSQPRLWRQQQQQQHQQRSRAVKAGKQVMTAGKSRPMTKSVSQPNLLPVLVSSRNDAVHEFRLAGEDNEEDEENMKKERIVQWLLEIRRHNVERPVTPEIEDDGPLQTDTALHIVYGGDQ